MGRSGGVGRPCYNPVDSSPLFSISLAQPSDDFASQAWPFPASLMLGFHAGATCGPIQLDGELEEARWFERQQLRSESVLLLPPPFTIARRLIEAWMLEQTHATRPRA